MWAWCLCFGDFLSALLSGQDLCCTVPTFTGHGFQAFANFLKQSEHCPLVANWRIAVSYRDPVLPGHLQNTQTLQERWGWGFVRAERCVGLDSGCVAHCGLAMLGCYSILTWKAC